MHELRQTGRTTRQLQDLIDHLSTNPAHKVLFVSYNASQKKEHMSIFSKIKGSENIKNNIVFCSLVHEINNLRGHRFGYFEIDHFIFDILKKEIKYHYMLLFRLADTLESCSI